MMGGPDGLTCRIVEICFGSIVVDGEQQAPKGFRKGSSRGLGAPHRFGLRLIRGAAGAIKLLKGAEGCRRVPH